MAAGTSVKLYFMLGTSYRDRRRYEGNCSSCREVSQKNITIQIPKEKRHGKVQIVVSTSFFVPKPFTPFQWAPMYTEQDFIDKAKVVKEEIRAQLNQKSIKYNWHEPDVTTLEGFLARGDRQCF